MITEDYVSYEVAKLLEEKGFPMIEQLYMYVNKDNKLMTDYQACITLTNDEYRTFFDDYIPTTTPQIVMKWLRNKYNFHIDIVPSFDREEVIDQITWVWEIINTETTFIVADSMGIFIPTYEDAVEAALKHCLTKLI